MMPTWTIATAPGGEAWPSTKGMQLTRSVRAKGTAALAGCPLVGRPSYVGAATSTRHSGSRGVSARNGSLGRVAEQLAGANAYWGSPRGP